MPIKRTKEVGQIIADYNQFKKRIPQIVGVTAVNLYKENFNKGGFLSGRGLERWKPRKRGGSRGQGRAILVQSARLKRSIRRILVTSRRVVVGTDVEYSQIHNEGGRITGQHRVRQHQRRTPSGSSVPVREHSREVNTEIPQRKFIGETTAVILRSNRIVRRKLEKIL